MTRDKPLILMLVGVATLAVAVIATLWPLGQSGRTDFSAEQWAAWQALSPTERDSLVRFVEGIQQIRELRPVLADGRRFAAASPETRVRYRAIHTALAEVLESLSPTQRRSVLDLPPEGRAAQLYRVMSTRFPEKLRALGMPQGNN